MVINKNQWYLKKLDGVNGPAKRVDPANFDKELEATNFANAKVKDLISQESQRRKSNNSNSNSGGKVEMPMKVEHNITNIDGATTPAYRCCFHHHSC